jgi:hypothetical protein
MDLSTLLGSNYQRAIISAKPLRKTLKIRWGTRGWRKETRQLMAWMWLTLASLDRCRQRWGDLRNMYDDSVERGNSGLVLAYEYQREVHATSTVDVTDVRSTLERIANTMETRALTLATGIGAVAGAIIGALIGHFI